MQLRSIPLKFRRGYKEHHQDCALSTALGEGNKSETTILVSTAVACERSNERRKEVGSSNDRKRYPDVMCATIRKSY